jgi:glyoxylase-like metal-dependent hydrolase (beta-lactamase superfamily II)
MAKDVKQYEWGKELVSGITALAAPGHTPGHTAFIVASGNGKLLVQGDTTAAPHVFLRNPGWHLVFDMDPAQAEATRRRIHDMTSAERMPVVGYHFPFPAVGNVAKDGNGYRFEIMHFRSVL